LSNLQPPMRRIGETRQVSPDLDRFSTLT
jgi:hypothetical protein